MLTMVPKTPLRVTFLQVYGIIEVLLNITKGRYLPITVLSNVDRSLTITFLKRLEYGILSPLITLHWLASWIIWRPLWEQASSIFVLSLKVFKRLFWCVLYTYQLKSFVKALMYYLLPKKSLLDQMFSDKEIDHNQDRKTWNLLGNARKESLSQVKLDLHGRRFFHDSLTRI